MSHRRTVIEVSVNKFIEDRSQEKGFHKCKRCEDSFKIKAGLCMHESWYNKLKQCNDTSKQTTNVSFTSNAGDENNKANPESESKIIAEVINWSAEVFVKLKTQSEIVMLRIEKAETNKKLT